MWGFGNRDDPVRRQAVPERLLQSYEEPADHEVASEIIRRRSTNPVDVREHVLAGRDLAWASRVLDLGCGFGFMAERLAPALHEDAVIWGVDLCRANRAEFLRRVRAQGRSARFVAMRLRDRLPWDTGSFDLIVSSYSLYFFPGLIPEIARVLDRRGLFLALTHTKESQRDLLDRLRVSEAASPLVSLVARFSVENAMELLKPSFGRVERVDYPNALRFTADDIDDLARYLRFKLLLAADAEGSAVVPSRDQLARLLLDRGGLVIRKDDAAFWCWEPRHPGNGPTPAPQGKEE